MSSHEHHECNKIEYLEKLEENFQDLKTDVKALDNNYIELTRAITKLTSEIETNRHWNKLTVTILSVTCAIIFGILQACLNML